MVVRWNRVLFERLPEHYPLFYHGRSGDSDVIQIMRQMKKIPTYKQEDVASEYSAIYLKRGRKAANDYLSRQVNKY